jgi:cyclase
VFYDITASPDDRTVNRDWVSNVAARLDIPFCVAGGIRSVADAEEILRNGADKISVNSPALENPLLIVDLAKRFGSQCVVLGIDSRRVGNSWQVYQYTGDANRIKETSRNTVDWVAEAQDLGVYTGDANRIKETSRNTVDWVAEAQDLGVGEIVLNCMNQDGVRNGYDIEQLAYIRESCEVPLVASGGAGKLQDFEEVLKKASVSAALAAGVFHDGEITIPDLKRFLSKAGVEVRL